MSSYFQLTNEFQLLVETGLLEGAAGGDICLTTNPTPGNGHGGFGMPGSVVKGSVNTAFSYKSIWGSKAVTENLSNIRSVKNVCLLEYILNYVSVLCGLHFNTVVELVLPQNVDIVFALYSIITLRLQ